MENWKPIPLDPRYEISDRGRIRRDGKLRKLVTGRRGYITTTFYRDGKQHGYNVHRLVMLAFVGPSDLQVNHKNGIKHDNRLENLEYVTWAENTKHAKSVLGAYHKGSKHYASKLTEQSVEAIHLLNKAHRWSHAKIAAAFGVNHSNITMILGGKTWTHVHPSPPP